MRKNIFSFLKRNIRTAIFIRIIHQLLKEWKKYVKRSKKFMVWKAYTNFLLQILPKKTRDIYLKKFNSSKNYWLNKGGSLPLDVVEELKNFDVSFVDLGKPNNNRKYKTEYYWIKFYDCLDEVPVKHFRLIPSYKRMCIKILKNETSCRYIFFSNKG